MRKVTISRLKPEKIDQYVEMHRNVPIEVCEIMAAQKRILKDSTK